MSGLCSDALFSDEFLWLIKRVESVRPFYPLDQEKWFENVQREMHNDLPQKASQLLHFDAEQIQWIF